jgi:hypothetical protein
MMKLIKLENNQFIHMDNFWNKKFIRNKFFQFLFITFILLSNTSAQNIEQTKATTTTATLSSSSSSSTRSIKLNTLNDEHAVMYNSWLDTMSTYLYDLTLTYSGFKNINETLNINLLEDQHANFAWINFTAMIIDISNTISNFLNNKTEIVKTLSDIAERAYEEYENEADEADEENYQYYNAKDSITFCDDPLYSTDTPKVLTLASSNVTNSTTLTNSTSNATSGVANKRGRIVKKSADDKEYVVIDPTLPHHSKHAAHRHHNPLKHLKNHVKSHEMVTDKIITDAIDHFVESSNFNRVHHMEIDQFQQDLGDIDVEDQAAIEKKMIPHKNLSCLTRESEEFFPQHLKVNRTYSTLHIPTNVFDRDREILRTARWSELLDEQFQYNLNRDKELFWQYFCSAHGLFRRFPGAFWDTPATEDFFDCRLQSWYISASASPKDVVILLDVSGSMTGLRLEIAKKLIESIMDTFTDNDFFNILTFSSTVQYLMNLKNETHYRDRLIQAGYYNKLTFVEKLKYFKNTSNMAAFHDAFVESFELLLSNKTDNCECNKVIMVITDGTTENAEKVFEKYNWNRENQVRVFSFMIGRDMTDPRAVKWMACANHGEFYHVATLADVNEHVHEYVPVMSRPMALMGVRETTWSNVFIGHIDKELKIAVARPAFKKFSKINMTKLNPETGEPINLKAEELLLGVVGVDVPVLKLISKVSPKFQMGVGIYIIMLDNNGYIVFHPSIKEEMKKSEFDYKGRSHSVDLNNFEIPIDNEDEFEELEHRMIDQKTDNQTLKNFKREGVRVVKRETEYVYTPVKNTPFSVAIASPKSFGRYYVDIPPEEEANYDVKLKNLLEHLEHVTLNTRVQLYNCSYPYVELIKKVLERQSDYCLDYSYNDHGQVLAIKADLLIHHLIYDKFNFTLYAVHKNLIRSYFYGTYSGMTFYLPVTFYRNITKYVSNDTKTDNILNTTQTISNNYSSNFAASSLNFEISMGHSRKFFKNDKATPQVTPTTTKPSVNNLSYFVEEAYNESVNMFTIEGNKHTFSFEKQYYTRSIEFSDFMRTEFNDTEPLVIYFLNESSRDTKRDAIGATLSIWLDKVPTAVSGVVYDAKVLQDVVFEDKMKCPNGVCQNLCSKHRSLNVSCYLVDEHGIVVLSTSERANRKEAIVGLPLYKANPWLMKSLQESGIYNLVIPGDKLKECRKPQSENSNAAMLRGIITLTISTVSYLISQISTLIVKIGFFIFVSFNGKQILNDSVSQSQGVLVGANRYQMQKIESINEGIINKNSNCYYFGIYLLNITKAKSLNASEFRVWCNNMRYLVGYVKHSNLVMVIAETEPDLSKCLSLVNVESEVLDESGNTIMNETSLVDANNTEINATDLVIDQKLLYSLNRYRKKPQHCYNKYPNESSLLPCSLATNIFKVKHLITNYLLLLVLFLCLLFLTVM